MRRNYAPGHTHASGLGWPHQRRRNAALAALQDGDLCARCELRGIEHPMWRSLVTRRPDGRYVAPLLDYDDFPGRRYGGPQVKRLSWAACNRGQGAVVTNQIRRSKASKSSGYTRW